ncbi:MAG TPA: hypothetical protein VK488_03845 [Gaiellaceae bacterium]|nr:hypothetical protein [Gaiellaceae bacterium]
MNLLQNLKIDDVSGVDDPANLLPGWLVQKSGKPGDLHKAQRDFQQLLSDVQARVDWDDDQKVEAMQKAIADVPEAISAPAIKGAVLASRIRERYLEKDRHSTGDALGRFAARDEINLDEKGTSTIAGDESSGPSLPWRHQGARIIP